MTDMSAMRDLLAQLSSANCIDEVGRALLRVSAVFGLSEALIVDLTKRTGQIGPSVLFASATREHVDAADAVYPLHLHTSAAAARMSDRLIVASRTQNALPPHLKHKEGLVVPVHADGQAHWYVAFAGISPDLSARAQSVVGAAVQAAFGRIRELSERSQPDLTRRETQCLRWVADGKTDRQVAVILEISPRTVRFHIDNAKVKLGVATRIQAVAKQLSGAA
jgi:DNA-binding CsgD family transcriptional regulator